MALKGNYQWGCNYSLEENELAVRVSFKRCDMRMEIKFGLSLKLILIVFFVSSTIITSLTYLNVQKQISFLEKTYLEKATSLAQALDASIGSLDELKNKEKLQNYIYKFIWLNPDVLKISINLPEKEGLKVAVSSDMASVGNPSSPDNYISYEKDLVVSAHTQIGNTRALTVITPLHVAGQRVGTYEMLLSMASADEVIAEQIRTFIIFGAGGLAFIVVFLIFLVRRIVLKRIIKLRDVANEIGKGNLNVKIEVKSKDEIGELASAFNQMTQDLKQSQKEIKRHAEELEQKVQERTKELNQKVKELTETKTALLNMMEDMEETNKELVQTQEELKKALKELRIMDEKKDQFISIAAHELKTPLTSIHGFSQLLQNRKVASNAKERDKYLKIMDRESKRLANLVSQILDLSRIDLGTVKLSFEEVDVNKFMQGIEREMRIQIKEKGLTSAFKLEKGLPKITTDREKLTEVIINLINNAVKYTPKGKITVRVSREGEDLHFMVKDTGVGISKENQDKIFERFYQVDSSFTRKAGGTGLGLALCKEFVELLGGKIWVKSEEGKGSEFHFTLPIKGAPKKYARKEERIAREALKKSEDVRKTLKKMGLGK